MNTSALPKDKTVLIVDDDKAIRIYIGRVLKNIGFNHCAVAENGTEALSYLKEHPGQVGLILSDRQMPDIDGKELLARIRGDAGTAAIPFLFVSAISGLSEEDIPDSKTWFIEKPFRPKQLAEALSSLMQKAG